MDESILNPIYSTEDYQGVRDVLSVIHDFEIVKKFIQKVKNQQIILADGHHRYEGSLEYRKKMMGANPKHTGKEAWNYHMMYLTNSSSDDLRILPTHRLVKGVFNFNEHYLLECLEKYFKITPVENPSDINEIILGKQWAFGLILKDSCYKVRLKPEVFDQMKWHFPEVVKHLDLTVMHYFIIEKIIGISGKNQRTSQNISFERNFSECTKKVSSGEAQMAIITREVTMKEVKDVCNSGYTMPQKSTYFYPKVICGYLFSSIAENEFQSPVDFGV